MTTTIYNNKNLNIKIILTNKIYILLLFLTLCIFSINYLSFTLTKPTLLSTKINISQIKLQQINIHNSLLQRNGNQIDKNVILNRNCTHIDAVYTWVNGSDPNILKKRMNAGFNIKSDMERYRDIGTLQFSLRSIHQFAPWIKNIWIITDSQIPDFIDIEKESNVRIIDHLSLFSNRSHLPTFNSISIESNFYNLPEEVSNCFLYFNDDVLLKSPVEPTDFFDSDFNQVLFEVDNSIGPQQYDMFEQLDDYHKSIVLSSQLLDKVWNEKGITRVKSDHGIQVYDRKILLKMYTDIGGRMDESSSHKTRQRTDIQISFLYNQFVKRYAKHYRIVKGFNFYGALTVSFTHTRLMLEQSIQSKAKVICLNDGLSGESKYFNQILYEILNY